MTDAKTRGQLAQLREQLEVDAVEAEYPGWSASRLDNGEWLLKKRVGAGTIYASGPRNRLRHQVQYHDRRRARA